jgi:serine/threonine-protein kinase
MNPVAETLADPMLGRLIDGRYEVRQLVAEGGMATVYVAFDRRLERSVAIKIMRTILPGSNDPHDFSSRFRREAKAAARLTHPGLVRVYDQGTDGEIAYLTMEYIEGENLRARLRHEATLRVGESLGVIESVLDALAAAHRLGLVHRDVKPENVLLDEDGRPKLADFGLARAVTEVTATSTGMIMGTVAYLGPELISRGHADARTDVYACGVMLFEMVTGRQPFTGGSAIDVASRHVHEDVPSPSIHVPWLPPELDDLVSILSARDPNARPADAAAALTRVRQTRAMIDDPTLDRRADPPSGALPVLDDQGRTAVLTHMPAGATVALPIGLGEPMVNLGSVDGEILEDDPEALPPQKDHPKAAVWIGGILAGLLLVFGIGAWWYATQGPGAYTTVPDVTGIPQEEAVLILESLGLEVVPLEDFSDDVLEGFVVRTDPEGQAEVPNGSSVELVVSLGPRMETVPDVVGVLEEDAIQLLNEAGFENIAEPTRVHSDTVPVNEVISTDPVADEVLPHFTEITLTVSMGPEPITIPDVVGMSEADAQARLVNDYAMSVAVVYERTLDQPKGFVFKTNPAANTEGTRAQTITIYVSDGPPLVTVPDFTFQTPDVARQQAEDLGLVVELQPLRPWSSPRQIVDQSLSSGSLAEMGATIVLYYN